MSNMDKITAEYRRKGLSEEVLKAEFLWPIINFLYCSYATKKVREMEIPKTRLMATAVSFLIAEFRQDLEDQYRVPDLRYSRLSKLLKCILFVQDINKSTRSSEVLGENARYILRDFLGRPIFTGSSEEGLAIYGNESMFRSDNYDELSYKLNHDIDIMYESYEMVAHELGSYTTPIEKNWVLNVLMRPGRKAGYVTLQKCIPKDIFDKIGSTKYIIGKIVELYPQPLEYVGQDKLVPCYLQTVAFLIDCERKIKPRDCDCRSIYEAPVSKDPNRYGDLCEACSRASLKEIYRGKEISPTKLWSDIIRIQGPSVHEITIIENESTQSKSRVPMNKAEAKEHFQKVLGIQRRKSSDRKQRRLPTVEPQLNDIFSSSGRKMIFVDHVPAIKCARWPSAAWEFIVRERPSGWPSDDLVKQIVEKGCHVIPKGLKAPPNTKFRQILESVSNFHDFMEWRISFSVAEKILTASLNEVQVKCYMLLKMLHEKVKEENRSAFSTDYKEGLGFEPIYPDSYFVKTAFFWACEKIPLSEWKDDNLGLCFIRVLDQLILFMENRTIPNYFIPSNNIIPVHNIDFKSFVPLCDTLLYSSFYWKYAGNSSEFLFESLQKIVWSSLWSVSEKKPPGSTPRDLKRIMRAMRVEDFDPWEVEEEEKTDSEDNHRKRVRQGKQSSEKVTDDMALLHDCAPNDDHLKSSCSKNSDAKQKTGNDSDARSTLVQWPCKLDKVLAQIFAAISKFIYTHGNTYGLGVNTARAAFYEEEAKKLLPAGCSLRDIEEYQYEVSDCSDDSDYTEDSDESEYD